jgi:signal peptidase I
MDGAKKNLEQENPTWDFEAVKKQNQDSWRAALGKIEVEDNDEEKKTVFYSSLYHTLIVPNTFSDVDGQYRGMDEKVHTSNTPQYTIFSLWDTYRATHPLYTIIETERSKDFIATFKNQYTDGGILPIWELAGNYTGCMIGYHSIPVIADAYFKGLTDISVDELLNMMITSANQDHLGLKAFKEKGYISIEDDAESVSKTLEYAYDDWCIAQVAKAAGKDSVYQVFTKRAQAYKNLLDPETNCMRPKLNEAWKTPFDPSEVDFNYTEANSWQYSFYVPHDVYTFMDYLGGEKPFEKQLDDLFNASSETKGRHQSDITGLIGQYAHGNEPSHHMAYLYNYVNQSGKTQKYVDQIINELYSSQPDGLCGNEDCGQMSAWYVFSAMGFYPVNPADGTYIIGKPQFEKVRIKLENGNVFEISKKGETDKKATVRAMELNTQKYTKSFIKHSDIMKGGSLVFDMSSTESIKFKKEDMPKSSIQEHIIVPTPSVRKGDRVFRDKTTVVLEAVKDGKVIYSLNGAEEKEYSEPIEVSEIAKITMYTILNGDRSKTVESNFYKIPEGRHIKLNTAYHPQYSAGGNDALIDGLTSIENFRTGSWQGFRFEDFEAVVDLGKVQKVSKVKMNFIQDARSWIWMPPYVEYMGSLDGKTYIPLGKDFNDIDMQDYSIQIKTFEASFYPKDIRYIKVFAKNERICPENHLGEGGQGYIFADEIIIE